MKNISDRFLAFLNITVFTVSFADAIEWALRVFLIIISIVISWPKFEAEVKKRYNKLFGEKNK